VRDHPGGEDILADVAGKNASEEYDEVGHSEDADEILNGLLIGTASDYKAKRSTAVKLVQQVTPVVVAETVKNSSVLSGAVKIVGVPLALAAVIYGASRVVPASAPELLSRLSIPQVSLPSLRSSSSSGPNTFITGFAIASVLSTIAAGVVGNELYKFTHVESGFGKCPPRRKAVSKMRPTNPHLVKGFLDAKEFKGLKVARIDKLSPNVYRYVFALPGARDVVGLPIGQHVAIKASIDGKTVQRSYTPTSNNLDVGVLELVVKVYPDGQLTGKYFANLKIGDEVQFRGPKGAMRYQVGHCTKIGMIAGGTGITPMYQLIRAICEDERDTTEVSLIFANRSEDDILLRDELQTFARRYPKNLKLWFMLDNAPPNWAYGSGFVTADVMREKLPAPGPETKFMLCGPPGMINASKKALASLGVQAPGAVAKMTDEIFSF
jgi:cytochrome-b5 reductase